MAPPENAQHIDLGTIPLFRGLGRIDRAKLIPHLTASSYQPGEYLVKQGDIGDALFIIVEGEARVVLRKSNGESVEAARLGKGECFGEIALVTGERRSADVIAGSAVKVLRLSRGRFNELMRREHTLAVHVAGVLAGRIRSTNEILSGGGPAAPAFTGMADAGGEIEEAPLPSSAGLTAGWSLKRPLRDRRVMSLSLAALACVITSLLLAGRGLSSQHLVLFELLLAATIVWSFDAFSYHAVALALPVAAVLFGAARPDRVFAGFSSSTWFLVLGVLAVSAAVSKTGLIYRLMLQVVSRFPSNYLGQSFALALAGLVLTPVIPSANARAILAGPLVANVNEILRFRKGSAGSLGMSVAALLGFGHMYFVFMNGTSTCLLVLGLLPREVSSRITWGNWFTAAFPLGLAFFSLSYLTALVLYRPRVVRRHKGAVIRAQLHALGPLGAHERTALWTVVVSLVGFVTQPWHHVDGAWVAMLSFLILFSGGVLGEKSIRTDIDWNFLISFGAIVGFGGVINSSGLGNVLAQKTEPLLRLVAGNDYLFLLAISLGVHLLRFGLPMQAASLISILMVVPTLPRVGIDPFVAALVVLISNNPWFFPFQNSIFLNLIQATEGKLFDYRQTWAAAAAHVLMIQVSIAISVPYWRHIGLLQR